MLDSNADNHWSIVAEPDVERIASALDPSEPTPLYHQVAAVVGWEIERGRISIGSLLPPIRQLARTAGINYHTVRRGYEELEAAGVVESRRGVGVRVRRAPTSTHWTPAGAVGLDAGTPRCWVVAGSISGAADLAAPLEERWRVSAGALAWDPAAPPLAGAILLPGSLANEAAEAWPEREGDLHPIDLVLEGATLTVVRRNVELLGASGVVLHGAAPGGALRELQAQLPRVGIALTAADDGAPVDPDGAALALVSPEAWEGLPWELRRHPRVMPLGWQFAPGPLARVARARGWELR